MSLDLLGEAPSRPIISGSSGYLFKKGGGKVAQQKSPTAKLSELSQRWSKRFFVLKPDETLLAYYKSENDFRLGVAALGAIECTGATVFLKEVVKGGVHRFSVRTAERELKLRAPSEAEYQSWLTALKPITEFDFVDADDDDDDGSTTSSPHT
jgi:hypothetical protein